MKENITEKVIFDKLTAPVEVSASVSGEPETVGEPIVPAPVAPTPVLPEAVGSGVDWRYAELCQTELGERIAAMDALRENGGQQPDGRGLRRLVKRLWRKLCAWYVEPRFARQSAFNASATPAVGRMAELHSLYGEGLRQMEQQLEQLRQNNHTLRTEQFEQGERLNRDEGRLLAMLREQDERLSRGEERLLTILREQNERLDRADDVLRKQSEWLDRADDVLREQNERLDRADDVLRKQSERLDRADDMLREQEKNLQSALERNESRFAERCARLAERCDALETRSAQLEELQRVTATAAAEAERKLQQLRELEVGLGSAFVDERCAEYDCAQNGEDRILRHVFRELGYRDEQCSYLDLGANHAKFLSNTWYFYRRGARGVLVEANPALIAELKLFRSGDVILNRCVAEKSGESMDFYILSGDGLSTPDKEGAESAIRENPALSIERTVCVESISVNELMDTYFDGAPRLLSLDIEGKEMDILRSIDFEKHRPLAVVIEMIPYRSTLYVGAKNDEILAFMAEKDYREYAFTGINSIFLDSRQLGRASV